MADIAGGDNSHAIAASQLKAFVERIDRMEEEKQTIAEDIKEIYGEAKGMGFDTKILKKAVKIHAQDRQKVTEEYVVLGLYLAALGIEGIFG